ncbi:MAG: hypothetical protein ACK5IQ_06170 [Bacteroidales bacterium]
MNFIEFKDKLFDFACFNINQALALLPDFDRNNITRWQKKGYILPLKQGFYTFSEYRTKADYLFFFANQIYKPSYISLHSALSFYGIIPESIVQITSVSSLKTSTFTNSLGDFSYKSVKSKLIFGYSTKAISNKHHIKIAEPEKALLDLLYLYSFYDDEQGIQELRLDEEFLQSELNMEKLKEYAYRFNSKSLDKRLKLLIKIYDLCLNLNK